ncbi:MAG: type VI secretion system ATPase TssH, partial [Verrucomicrobiota bacterium]|nr:type VI secretion system ATPase TssH [Verrucomicrobiota bacterium]
LNRVDETIIFDRLSDQDIKAIVDIQLARLMKRLDAKKLALTLSDQARTLIASEGYDPVYGARPLKRVIQHELLDPLSMEILAGRFGEGAHVKADVKDGKISFSH